MLISSMRSVLLQHNKYCDLLQSCTLPPCYLEITASLVPAEKRESRGDGNYSARVWRASAEAPLLCQTGPPLHTSLFCGWGGGGLNHINEENFFHRTQQKVNLSAHTVRGRGRNGDPLWVSRTPALVHGLSFISFPPVPDGLINGDRHSSDSCGKVSLVHYLRCASFSLENGLTQSVDSGSPQKFTLFIVATSLTLVLTVHLLFHWHRRQASGS